MDKLTHWTDESTDDFLYKIAADFVRQLENHLGEVTQQRLADRLGVTPGRVSQVLNKPGNLTLKKCIQYARALGKKVALVAYDDGDSENINGPVNAQIFERCWINAGRPADFFALEDSTAIHTYLLVPEQQGAMRVTPTESKSNTGFSKPGAMQSAGTDSVRSDIVCNPGASTHG